MKVNIIPIKMSYAEKNFIETHNNCSVKISYNEIGFNETDTIDFDNICGTRDLLHRFYKYCNDNNLKCRNVTVIGTKYIPKNPITPIIIPEWIEDVIRLGGVYKLSIVVNDREIVFDNVRGIQDLKDRLSVFWNESKPSIKSIERIYNGVLLEKEDLDAFEMLKNNGVAKYYVSFCNKEGNMGEHGIAIISAVSLKDFKMQCDIHGIESGFIAEIIPDMNNDKIRNGFFICPENYKKIFDANCNKLINVKMFDGSYRRYPAKTIEDLSENIRNNYAWIQSIDVPVEMRIPLYIKPEDRALLVSNHYKYYKVKVKFDNGSENEFIVRDYDDLCTQYKYKIRNKVDLAYYAEAVSVIPITDDSYTKYRGRYINAKDIASHFDFADNEGSVNVFFDVEGIKIPVLHTNKKDIEKDINDTIVKYKLYKDNISDIKVCIPDDYNKSEDPYEHFVENILSKDQYLDILNSGDFDKVVKDFKKSFDKVISDNNLKVEYPHIIEEDIPGDTIKKYTIKWYK